MNNYYRNVYLKSDRWRALRLSVLKDKCYCCGFWDEDNERLEIHHTSYRNIKTDKEKDDLICVCSQCHDDIHEDMILFPKNKRIAHNIIKRRKAHVESI